MKVLIEVGHPAHVHLFKNVARVLIGKGHSVLFTCKDREFVIYLLEAYGFQYRNFGKHYKTPLGKVLGLIKNDIQMLLCSIRFKPDLFLSHGSTIASHSAFIIRKPHIALEDTFNMEQVRLCLPFAAVVLTGDYPHPPLGKKEISYPGYHELAHLHPNVYQSDEAVLKTLGVEKNERYAIVRFVAWAASHDIGHKGITSENKLKLVRELSKHLKVFISSEGELEDELKQYQIKIKPEQMHDALNYAHLFVGESATMASESAVLGTPAIYLDDVGRGYTDDQEKKYKQVFNYSESEDDQLKAIEKAVEIAKQDNIKVEYAAKRDKMLEEKIDVTAFMVWFVENYPDSEKEMRKEGFSFDRFRT